MAYSFVQLAPNWSSLTPAQKEALFNGTNYQSATLAELQTLGEFKVLCYSDSSAGSASAINVRGVHNDFIVLPNQLFGQIFNKIKSMTVTESISDTTNSKIRYILTKDLINYFTYDGTNWVSINPTPSDVLNDGMSADDLANLSSAQWLGFFDGDNDKDGIGIGIAFQETAITQTTAVDNLGLTIDLQGSWYKAEHMTDYQYGYPANDVLHVELKTNGNYKINYGSGGSGGGGSSSGDTITIASDSTIDNLFV